MTAISIIESDVQPVVVAKISIPPSQRLASSFSNWLGGKSGLGHSLDQGIIRDPTLWLSSHHVAGLSAQVVLSNVSYESFVGAPFSGAKEYQVLMMDIFTDADDYNMQQMDWENQAAEIWIGEIGAAWSTFTLLLNGKTIGKDMSRDSLTVTISPGAIGNDNLFPASSYTDGDSKGSGIPYAFGNPKKVNPVNRGGGLWQVNDNVLASSTSPEWDDTPAAFMSPLDSSVLGDLTYTISANNGTETDSTATDEFPADHTQNDGTVTLEEGFIQCTLPDRILDTGGAGFGDRIDITLHPQNDHLMGTTYTHHRYEVDIEIDDSSTATPDAVLVGNEDISSKIGGGVYTFITPRETDFSINSVGIISMNKSTSQNADTIIVNILAIRCIFERPTGPSNEYTVYNPQSGNYLALRTYRVTDVETVVDIPTWLAIVDDNGNVRVNSKNTGFVVDVTGRNITTAVAQASEMYTQAVGAGATITGETQTSAGTSPTTAAFLGPATSVYISERKPVLDHVRELLHPLDMRIEFSLTTDAILARRRWDKHIINIDGDANVVDWFDLDDEVIDSTIATRANEPPVDCYIVKYDKNYSNESLSLSTSDASIGGRLNNCKTIETCLDSESSALEISGLVYRDGGEKVGYSLDLVCSKWLQAGNVGKVTNDKMRPGHFELRKVIVGITEKGTKIEGFVHV